MFGMMTQLPNWLVFFAIDLVRIAQETLDEEEMGIFR